MKLNVGRNSIIANAINSILSIILSTSIIYLFCLYTKKVADKYNETIAGFIDGYNATAFEFTTIILLGVLSLVMAFILLYHLYNLLIGIHYFSKTKTQISSSIIQQTEYCFPYNMDSENIIVDDISKIAMYQSSIERIMNCGTIFIKGYSNSNYSKTDFKLHIEGVDNILEIKDSIELIFKSALAKNKNN